MRLSNPIQNSIPIKSGQNLFIWLLSSFLLFNISTTSVSAQVSESCDLCGWCSTDQANKPSEWNKCMLCLFPDYASNHGINDTYAGPKPAYDESFPHYPASPEVPKHWTVFGCLDTAPGGFVTQIYQILIAFGSGLAFLSIVYGGFEVLTAGGDPIKIAKGKHIIMGAIFGVMMILFSVFFLKLIGFDIIKIPGFGE